MADFDFDDATSVRPSRPLPPPQAGKGHLRVIILCAVALTGMVGVFFALFWFGVGGLALGAKKAADKAAENRRPLEPIVMPKAEHEDAKDTTKPQPKAIQAGDWFILGDVRVRVRNAAVGPVRYKKLFDKAKESRLLLVIALQIRNRSETKKADLHRWNKERDAVDAELKDEFGNEYKPFIRPIGVETELDLPANESIYPGKDTEDAVIFEPPVEKAKRLTLTLKGSNVGTPGMMYFTVDRSFWDK